MPLDLVDRTVSGPAGHSDDRPLGLRELSGVVVGRVRRQGQLASALGEVVEVVEVAHDATAE